MLDVLRGGLLMIFALLLDSQQASGSRAVSRTLSWGNQPLAVPESALPLTAEEPEPADCAESGERTK